MSEPYTLSEGRRLQIRDAMPHPVTPEVTARLEATVEAIVSAALAEQRGRVEAKHEVAYRSNVEIVCTCGEVVSVYGLTIPVISAFGNHLRAVRAALRGDG